MPHGRRQRPPLSRTLIIERATAMIDRDGVASLTMRSLGSALGVEAMSLYRRVTDRADLLDGIVESLMDAIEVEPGTMMDHDKSWRPFLRDVAHEVRRVALDHPVAFSLVATRHPGAPWLRPPLRSLRIAEAICNGLLSRGLTERQAVAAYRSFSLLLGHLLFECAIASTSPPPTRKTHHVGGTGGTGGTGGARLRDVNGGRDLRNYPTLSRLQPRLMANRAEAEFEQALDQSTSK